MPTIGQIIHTLISRILLILLIALLIIPGIIMMIIPQKWRLGNPLYGYCMDFFYRATLWITFIPVRYKGSENLPEDPVIIASNHQSSLDILLIGKLVHRFPHVWLATRDLLASPLLRFIIPRFTTLIDTSSPMKAMRSLVNALNLINDNKRRHAIIFPEGSRYTDGKVHEFYAGFVILAKKTGRPVVPVRIFNAEQVYPPKTFWIQSYPITVVVGKPLYCQENETDEAFKQRVYQWFLEQKED